MSDPYGSENPQGGQRPQNPQYGPPAQPGQYGPPPGQYPPQYPQGGQYPQYPQGGDVYRTGPAPRGPAPSSVVLAVRLMIVRAGIGVISLIVLFATKDDLKKRILENTPNATDSTVNTALTIGAVIGIAVLIFYVFLAFQVRKGANWARIVTWVIAGLAILGAVTGFTQPEPPLTRILNIVVGVIDLAIVILLARGTSNEYFRGGRRA